MNEGNLKFRFVRAVIWIVGYVEDTPCSTNQMTLLTIMNFVAASHSSIHPVFPDSLSSIAFVKGDGRFYLVKSSPLYVEQIKIKICEVIKVYN